MSARFQLRRWPDDCPPLIGELAVVDTSNGGRIVRTYRDAYCMDRGGAFKAAEADAAKWNADPPHLVPTFRSRTIVHRRLPDGTIEMYQPVESARWDELSFEYAGL